MTDGPFARAVVSFIEEVKSKEDVRSPFYQHVLLQASHHPPLDPEVWSSDLARYIQELESKQSQTSKIRLLSDKLQPLLNGLNQYVQAFDVMIQAGPAPAVLLYGGARLVLQLGSSLNSCFEIVTSIMEDVGHLLKSYQLFSSAYPSEDMQDLLVKTYKNIILFWRKASKLLHRKTFKTVLRGFVVSLEKEWQKCRGILHDDADRVRMLAQAIEADTRRQKTETNVDNQEVKLRRDIANWVRANEDDESLDVRADIREHLSKRHSHTCNWLFELPAYQSWLKSRSSTSVLWYSALPGTGKTMLASVLAQRLQDEGRKAAVFLFAFDDVARRAPVTALRCLGLQLLKLSDKIPDAVKRLWEEEMANYRFGLSDVHTACQLVKDLLRHLERIHIVIDGLDECKQPEKLSDLLSELLSMKPLGLVKWFLISRSDSTVGNRLRQNRVTQIDPPEDSIRDDIRRFISDRLRDKVYHECKRCEDYWTKMSEGNFLWIHFIFRILQGETVTCKADIHQELRKFPRGLTACYTRGLAPLVERPPRHQQLARSIFSMIVGALQPLRLSEISHALVATKSADFDADQIPWPQLIEDLCSNLIHFDRTRRGTETDPMLKVGHRSIHEFLLQDPAALGVPHDLHQFFVKRSTAELELGRACLAYLSHRRYHLPQDVTMYFDNPQHAFIRHAATMWLHYLYKSTHSKELFKQVRTFVRSPAFWTCVAVQCRVAPHLFARFLSNSGGRFSIEAGTSSTNSTEDGSINYGVALPGWLDEYPPHGCDLVSHFYSFVREWHPVLNSYPGAQNECVMDRKFGEIMSGRGSWLSKRVRLFPLSMLEPWPDLSELSIVNLVSDGGDVVVIHLNGVPREQNIYSAYHYKFLLQLKSGSCQILKSTQLGSACLKASASVPLQFSAETCKFISLDSLQVAELDIAAESSKDSQTWSDKGLPRDYCGPWTLVNQTVCHEDADASTMLAAALHLSLTHVSQDKSSSTHVSNNKTDSKITPIEEEQLQIEHDECQPPNNQDCMVVIPREGPPIWQHWKAAIPMEVRVAYHPTKPLVVWSQAQNEIVIASLFTREVRSMIFPEPPNIQFSSTMTMHKEFHFSKSGDRLYYLLGAGTSKKTSVHLTVSLSSFYFPDELEDCLQRDHQPTSVSYEFAGSLKCSLMLTTWTSEHLYLALPPLSCNPKIARIPLCASTYSTPISVQTLRHPVYFPSTTPHRKPCIRIVNVADQTTLILSLDAEIVSGPSGMRNLPTIMMWHLDEIDTWRQWYSDDEATEQLRSGKDMYMMLRGSFVDEERRFQIPIRNGLDHTKKAYVSCA